MKAQIKIPKGWRRLNGVKKPRLTDMWLDVKEMVWVPVYVSTGEPAGEQFIRKVRP